MKRSEIINIVGIKYLDRNQENDEFNYQTALKKEITGNKILDIRFENERKKLSVLIETKQTFKDKDQQQLFNYVDLERQYRPKNNIIAILADTKDDSDRVKIWKNGELLNDNKLNHIDYYLQLFEQEKRNDKEKIIQTTKQLNQLLHKFSIKETNRAQFVGSCLVALNSGLEFNMLFSTKEIIERIKEKLHAKIKQHNEQNNKKSKIEILLNVLKNQEIEELKSEEIQKILNEIKDKIIPYINDRTNEGEDLLNLFFTTFNKYVGKADKNQAFTPPILPILCVKFVNYQPIQLF